MLINVMSFDKDKSDPIINSISLDTNKGQFFEAWYMREYHMVKHQDLSSKQIFKKIFGRQRTCVNILGWYRTWIWTFSNEVRNATIYCLIDIRGVRWEMDIGSDLKGIIWLRDEIEKRLIA